MGAGKQWEKLIRIDLKMKNEIPFIFGEGEAEKKTYPVEKQDPSAILQAAPAEDFTRILLRLEAATS